ncbi:DegT/DnrJ/EryC1/StrS family aminotransferase (plasmid) [Rhizobium sp. T1473]|uniref:DegT/DnrJ/EryC1/StrS family aminotransferase n=2 Tax=unclassified Rhizobium TaxID=2613769 RepID=UPI001AC39059
MFQTGGRMLVPFYSNTQEMRSLTPDLRREFAFLVEQDTLVNGPMVKRFEKELSDYTGAKYVIATSNASDALELVLRSLGIGPGDEVIVPCYSYFSSVSCIRKVGATPVFVDIDAPTYALNLLAVEAAITRDTKAIMVVHLFCQMADMQALNAVATRHQVLIVEDSAEAIGMTQNGVHAGRFGSAGVLSFFPTKTLGALGDAGAIITDDPKLAVAMRQTGDLGRDGSGLAVRRGICSRMDDWHAIVLSHRLRTLKANIERRQEVAALYSRLLGQVPDVQLPRLTSYVKSGEEVFYVYLVQVEQRDELAKFLLAQGIVTETYYPMPLHLQPAMSDLGYRVGCFPVAETAASKALALPIHPEIQKAQIEYTVEAIARFYSSR